MNQLKVTMTVNVPAETLQNLRQAIERLSAIDLNDLKVLGEQLEAQKAALRWATDPLSLMPLFDVPRLAISAYLRSLGNSLIAIADSIE